MARRRELQVFLHEMPFELPAGTPEAERRHRDFARRWAAKLQAALRDAAPRRTGRLRRSIEVDAHFANTDRGSINIRIDDPAARALEHGGIVRGSPYMAIPLQRYLENFTGPRQTGTYVTVQSADGRLFLVTADSKRFSYVLKQSVFLRKQPFIARTIKRLEPQFTHGTLRTGVDLLTGGRQ